MKLRHLMTAALGGLMLSCQGPAAVLAQEATANAAAAFPTQPIAVLVGPGTFSAAEAAAYDLRAATRATGGGGNPSSAMDLGPWFTVGMPIGEARHPATGTNREGVGVQPA